MKKYIGLIKNIGLLTIGNFSTKLLSFILVPLYTNVLTTAEYGEYDIINITISLLIPILTLNIQEAILRFALDYEDNYSLKKLFSNSVIICLLGVIVVIVFAAINNKFVFFPSIASNSLFFILMYTIQSFQGVFSYFARGLNKIKEFSIAGVVGTIITVIFNMLFLLVFNLGLTGYFLANILGSVVQILYLMTSLHLCKFISVKLINKKMSKELIKYSTPLITNNLSWWINNASDRYIVTAICGLEANGVYSVGYKIPTILTTLANIFGQAWVISSVKEFDEQDKDGFFSQIYSIYNLIMVFSCSLIILLDKLIANLLYAKDFYAAWKYAPFLLISVVFSSLSTYLGGILTAKKDTKSISISSLFGALINLILNILLVIWLGALGAAIATAVSFMIMWLMRFIRVKKIIKIHVNILRDSISYILLVVQTLTLLSLTDTVFLYLFQAGIVMAIAILYKTEIQQVIKSILKAVK